jgi:hypothetical protein
MSLNMKVLAVAIVGGLFATSAQAAVNLAASPSAPVTIASELKAPATITNTGNALDIVTPLKYAFSNGEVRYARIECASHIRFAANSTAAYSDGGGTAGTVALGAINGLGTNAISFSVTATSDGVGDNANDSFIINGDRLLDLIQSGSCTYGLYDQPSQAANGGTTGRIAFQTGAYLATQSGYSFTATPDGNPSVADVESSPVFSRFVPATSTWPDSTTLASLSRLVYDARTGDQLDYDGSDITLVDMMAAGSAIEIEGDFSGFQSTSRVFLSVNTNCSTKDQTANSVTATKATFVVGASPRNHIFCLEAGTSSIAASEYKASFVPVSNTNYNVVGTGPLAAGSIIRNGTELQAPLAQVPEGYLSRIALTNTGSLVRSFQIRVHGEDGNTIGTANLTGTIPANGTRVVDLTTVLTSFSGKPRATIVVTIAGPNKEIQGLYQIVRPDTGALSNHVMVRPGTN